MTEPRYDWTFREDNSHGHAVALLTDAAAPPGTVLDLGCGYAAVAAPLRERGFDYVGFDSDEEAIAAVRARGFDAHVTDLSSRETADRIAAALGSRRVAAVMILDVLEHLTTGERFLDLVCEYSAPVIVSIPNVTHFDVASKLLAGRWEMTETGILDETHVRFYTLTELRAAMARRGLREIAGKDVTAFASDQHFPADHPYLHPESPACSVLHEIRDAADSFGTAVQFVRAYRPAPEATSRADVTPPLVTAVVIDGGTPGLDATLASLGDHDGLEVVVARAAGCPPEPASGLPVFIGSDGDPTGIASAVGAARGRYLTFVPAGEIVPSNWLLTIEHASVAAPNRVIRCRVPDADDASRAVRIPAVGPGEIDLLSSALFSKGPLSAHAVPTHLHALMSRAEEHGDLAPWCVVLDAIRLHGAFDTEEDVPITTIDGEVARGTNATQRALLVGRIDQQALLLPLNAAGSIDRLLRALDLVGRSTSWRVTAPLRAMARVARRLRRRLGR
jgi:hypothetical protein